MFCPSSFDKLIIWLLLKLERSVPEGDSCYDGSDLADHQSDFINRLHHTSHLLMQPKAKNVSIRLLDLRSTHTLQYTTISICSS